MTRRGFYHYTCIDPSPFMVLRAYKCTNQRQNMIERDLEIPWQISCDSPVDTVLRHLISISIFLLIWGNIQRAKPFTVNYRLLTSPYFISQEDQRIKNNILLNDRFKARRMLTPCPSIQDSTFLARNIRNDRAASWQVVNINDNVLRWCLSRQQLAWRHRYLHVGSHSQWTKPCVYLYCTPLMTKASKRTELLSIITTNLLCFHLSDIHNLLCWYSYILSVQWWVFLLI